ncbi:alpha/beta hydrolase [Caballeronia grimmiae]|uniref:hypothetical protein n=1 Tax=Caballeronia grimmiae TaxID=1071679 RepID=UPI0038BCF945
MPLVLLHGIAQENHTEESLQKLWCDSLVQGLDYAGIDLNLNDMHISIPYYGLLLAGLPVPERAKSGRPVDVDDQPRSSAATISASAAMQREIIDELNRKRGLTSIDDQPRGPKNTFLGVLERLLSDKQQARIVDLVITQTAAYFTTAGIRERIQSRAQSALQAANQARTDKDPNLVVVGHSLGSVVGMEALSAWVDSAIDLFVTIGSPLGIGSVHSRLTDAPARWPSKLKRWINVADRDDAVAVYGVLDRSNLFKRVTESNRAAAAHVFNIVDVKNHMPNHHGIAGYLDDPVVARVIRDGIVER